MNRCDVRGEAGLALIPTLLLTALLLVVAASGLLLSRTDLLISANLVTGTQALWVARAGVEAGKTWIESHTRAQFPSSLGPVALAAGAYSVEIDALSSGRYRLTSVGAGPQGARRVVEEVIQVPEFTPVAALTTDGMGAPPDFDDQSSGTGRRIPDFSIDGRNHDLSGNLSGQCADIAPFGVTGDGARLALGGALDRLKRDIVRRAESFCDADGRSRGTATCTPGLSWVRGFDELPRFSGAPCGLVDPACYLRLDLAAPGLRATDHPARFYVPTPPADHGPFSPSSAASQTVRVLDTASRQQLRAVFDAVRSRVVDLSAERLIELDNDLSGGRHRFGTEHAPRVTRTTVTSRPLQFQNGATVSGVGLLIVSRPVRLQDVRFDWRGLIVLDGAGDLSVANSAVCGRILGAVVIRDRGAQGRKLDWDMVRRQPDCAPLRVKYSCDAVSGALALLMRTVSWTEQFGA